MKILHPLSSTCIMCVGGIIIFIYYTLSET